MLKKIREYLYRRRTDGSIAGQKLFAVAKWVFHAYHKMQHWLRIISPKKLYRQISKSSIFFRENEMGMCSLFPEKILGKTLEIFQPRTVLDLGCGTGKSLDYFLAQGIKASGVEGSKLAINKANRPELITQYDLNQELNLGKKFDLVWSFEFVEHIHPKYVDNLMKTFANHAETIVLSAARPGQGGEGHFNEQPAEYWIEKFKKFNYKLNEEATKQLRDTNEKYSENMLVFEK